MMHEHPLLLDELFGVCGGAAPALLQPHRLQAEKETPTSPYWSI